MRHATRIVSVGALALVIMLAGRPAAAETIVTFVTNLGAFDVQLFDTQAPTTVQNFLNYVNDGRYTNTFFHRTTTYNAAFNQIVQGGSFGYTGSSFFAVSTGEPIPLKAGLSNVRGTIAMARTNAPNSATSGWFFNVQDNSAAYDPATGNDGYAVFGEVIGDGMQVIDLIASLPYADINDMILGPPDPQNPLQPRPFGNVPLYPLGDNTYALALVENVVAVPEPTALALALSALVGIAALRRRILEASPSRSRVPLSMATETVVPRA